MAGVTSTTAKAGSNNAVDVWSVKKVNPQNMIHLTEKPVALAARAIQYYAEPIVPTEGKGLRLKDADGNEYLDFFGGILTVSLGYANDRVNAAIVAQLNRFSHVSSLYPTPPVVELAERLARITPGRLEQSCFTASGTEADETAVMCVLMLRGPQTPGELRSRAGRPLRA